MGKRINTAVWLENQKRWQIKVQKDGDRKTFTSSKPGRTGQREANAKADAWLDDNIISSNKKCSELIKIYLSSVEETTSKSHYNKVFSIFKNYISPVIGNKKVSSLIPQDFQNIINKSYKRKKKDSSDYYLSRKTLLGIKAEALSFLKYCRKCKVTNLFVEDLKVPAGSRYKEKYILQPLDISKLFTSDITILKNKEIFDEYIYAYRFQVLTGLRPGELRGIKHEDIDGDILSLKRSINVYNEITKGKNNNAIRSINLSVLALDCLNKQRELYIDSEYVFPISSSKTFLQRWNRYCNHNNISPISLYELRHTFVSIAKNLPESQLKQIVGHSRNMDTYGIYSHEIAGEKKQAADTINNIFSNILDKK